MTSKTNIAPEELSLRQQNYIEAIAELVESRGQARTSDIARMLKVRKASVSEAISRLTKIGIVRRDGYEIELTQKGLRVALELEHRHQALRRFMVDTLEMDSDQADSAACRIEHSTGSPFIERLLMLEIFLGRKDAADFKKSWRRFMKTHAVTRQKGENS